MLARNLVLAILPLFSLAAALPIVETSLLGPLANSGLPDSLTPQDTTSDSAITKTGLQQRSSGDDASGRPPRPLKGLLTKVASFKGPRMPWQSRFPGEGRRVGSLSEREGGGESTGQSSAESVRSQREGEGKGKGEVKEEGEPQSPLGPHSFKNRFGSPNNFNNRG
ncbi:hypothetical protein PspLS_04317 [Pyricularia sp. CBS 133598]|nr:hypothetical protein PspLS_04317 [Pyricularia sp. CBS 133598]